MLSKTFRFKKLNKIISTSILIGGCLIFGRSEDSSATRFFRTLFTRFSGNLNSSSSNISLNSRTLSSNLRVGNVRIGPDDNKTKKMHLLDNLKSDLERNLDVNSSIFGSLLSNEPDSFERRQDGSRFYGYNGDGIRVKVKTNDNGVVTNANIKTSNLIYTKNFSTNSGSITENKYGLRDIFESGDN